MCFEAQKRMYVVEVKGEVRQLKAKGSISIPKRATIGPFRL